MNSQISFILNDTLIETEINPATVVLDFIRNNRLTGTKEGCKEGDCGACTILVGETINDKLVYKAVNSCLLPIGNVSGKHLVTIEGLNCEKNVLNPIQQAFVDEGATQCGFCTPGFIVSMTGYLLNNSGLRETDLINSLDGNICRCTGHNSIIRAAEKIYNNFNHSLIENKYNLKNLTENKFIPEYFLSIKKRLEKLTSSKITRGNSNIDFLVSNGTDLFVQKPDEMMKSGLKLLQNDNDLNGINIVNGECIIGSNTTVTDLQHSDILKKYFPDINKFILLFGSAPIRNSASVGGNLNNASPIGDMTNFFMALNSVVTLTDGSSNRDIPLKKYYLSYKKTVRKQDEIMKCIMFKLPQGKYFFNFEKVSKRTYLDIASVNTSVLIYMEKNIISEIHLSAGGVSAIPLYLAETCEFLTGKVLNIVNVKKAVVIAQTEISPITDARGSAEYKRLLLTRLIFTHFLVLFPEIFKAEDTYERL